MAITCSRAAFMCPRQLPMLASGRRLESGEDMGTALSGTSLPRMPSMNSIWISLRAACRTMPSRRSDRDGRPTTNIFSNCKTSSHLGHNPTQAEDGRNRESTHAKGAIADIARETACCGPPLVPGSVPGRIWLTRKMKPEEQKSGDNEGGAESVENPSRW